MSKYQVLYYYLHPSFHLIFHPTVPPYIPLQRLETPNIVCTMNPRWAHNHANASYIPPQTPAWRTFDVLTSSPGIFYETLMHLQLAQARPTMHCIHLGDPHTCGWDNYVWYVRIPYMHTALFVRDAIFHMLIPYSLEITPPPTQLFAGKV